MIVDQARIQELVSRPSEGLSVEIKRWIDTSSDDGIATIVKACFAIRNYNGGFVVFGFDDETLLPQPHNRPADVRAAFHTDTIQGIISKYAQESFEVGIGFAPRDELEHAVIVIPEGVTAPVIVKRNLIKATEPLLRVGDPWVRTLSANGTPSTARAGPDDWRKILDICFENREADIGRFLRRHLAGRDVSALMSALAALGTGQEAQAAPSLCDSGEALRAKGDQRFQAALADYTISPEEKLILDAGRWSVGLVLDSPRPGAIADQSFLNIMLSSNPAYTGWPPWIDSRHFIDRRTHPRVKANA